MRNAIASANCSMETTFLQKLQTTQQAHGFSPVIRRASSSLRPCNKVVVCQSVASFLAFNMNI